MRIPSLSIVLAAGVAADALAARLPSLYAHPTVEDAHGVIAPWHDGLNGQLDERVSIAVDVYKRYPWVDANKAVLAAPDFVYNSHWSIKPDGTILVPPAAGATFLPPTAVSTRTSRPGTATSTLPWSVGRTF